MLHIYKPKFEFNNFNKMQRYISKLISSKILLTSIPKSHFSTTTTSKSSTPLTIWKPEQYPNLEISLSLIQPHEADSCLNSIGDTFMKDEPLTIASKTTREILIRDAFLEICTMGLEDKLAFVAKNNKTGEHIGLLYCADRLSLLKAKGICLDESIKQIFMIFEECEKLARFDYPLPKEPYEQLYFFLISVEPKYQRYGISKWMFNYFLNEYPLSKNSKFVYAHCTAAGSRKMTEKFGFKCFYAMPYAHLKGKPEFSRMQLVRESIADLKGPDYAKELSLMVLER